MKENRFTIFFFALVFAFLVWISVNMGNTFQATIDLPVSVENLQPTRAIAAPIPDHIRVRFQGTGWQIVNAYLSPNLRYTIDLRDAGRKDTLFTYKRLSERINLPTDVHVFETNPDTIVILLDQKVSRRIPVRPRLNVTYRDGFGIVGPPRAEPESISVTGARSLLNAMRVWPTLPVTLSDVNAPVTVQTALAETLSLETSRSAVTAMVSFDVQPIAEKRIDNIPVDVNQVPEYRSVVLIPPTVSIIIRSGVNAVAPLNEKDFYAFIDYRSILLDTSGFVQPTILGPDNVKIVQQTPERTQYVIRK